jgi:hypothetical protein
MKTSKIPKGKDKSFAAGGKTPMLGKSDRTKSAYPAEPQNQGGRVSIRRSLRQSVAAVQCAPVPLWAAAGARPIRADRRLERIPDLRTRIGEAAL